MKAGIILQARTGSQRLRGKVLEPIAGRPLVGQCIRRLAASGVAPIILATTTLADDDALAAAGADAGVPVFRGAAEDVLDRFARGAAAFQLDVVIRATADNPAVDIEAPARLLDAMARLDVDYVREDDLPYGAGAFICRDHRAITILKLDSVGENLLDAFPSQGRIFVQIPNDLAAQRPQVVDVFLNRFRR